MILHSLRLYNFRRFRRVEIEFPENVIGLLGRNGAGKSTLLEAIAWALYGSRASRTDKLQIRSQFVDERDSCEVELAFKLGSEKYRVFRSLAGKNAVSEAALYHGDSLDPAAVRDSGVNQEIERLLGLEQRAFEVSIFAKQKELAALSDLQNEERRKIVSRLINLEAVDRARQQVMGDANAKRKFLEGAQTTQVDLTILAQELEQQQALLQTAQNTLQQHEERSRQFAAALEKARQVLDAETARRDQHQRLQAELSKSGIRLQELANQQRQIEKDQNEIIAEGARLEALRPAREQHEALRRERDTLQLSQQRVLELQGKQALAATLLEQNQSKKAESEKCQQQLEAFKLLDEQEKTATARYQEAQTEVLQGRGEESRLGKELESVKTRGTDFRAKLAEVQKLGTQGSCPVCTRPLNEQFDTVVKYYEDELAQLRKEYTTKDEARKKAEALLQQLIATEEQRRQEKENFRAQRERLHLLQSNWLRQQSEMADLQKRLQTVQNEIQQLGPVHFDAARLAQVQEELRGSEARNRELTQLETRAALLPGFSRRLAETQEQITGLQQNDAELQKQLGVLQYNEETYLAARQTYDTTNTNYLRSEQELSGAKVQVAVAETETRKLDESLDKAREHQAAIARAKQEIVVLDSLQEHLKNFRAELAGRLRPLIADRASELLRLITAGRYNLLELDESYNIFLYDQNARHGISRFSGGEQDVANLCLRVAISQVIAQRTGKPPLQFIVLDEIFGSQDEERKMMMLAALQQLNNYFRQIFLVTHVESIKDNLPVALQVEMAGEASEVKVL